MSLGMETVNLVGLANATVGLQGHTPGLALNAVGLQVLANAPTQSSPAPPAHIPRLQIIALPHPDPLCWPIDCGHHGDSLKGHSQQQSNGAADPRRPGTQCWAPTGVTRRPSGNLTNSARSLSWSRKAWRLNQNGHQEEALWGTCVAWSLTCAQPAPTLEALQKVATSAPPSLPTDRAAPRPPVPHRQPIVHFSGMSSNNDEERLVIAT
jgi:HIV type I enhancer-binding protein